MKHLLKVLPLLLLAVLMFGLVACSAEIVDPGNMPDVGTLPASYTVTFCDRQGNVIKTSTVREGEAAVPPSASQIPTVEGYDFVGWDADLTQVTGDMTVTARYARSEYTVNFRMPDGSLIESRTFARLSDTTAPDVPEAEGKHFVGWAFAEGTAVDPAIVRFDAELYAVYETNVYKVTFVDAEGSVTVEVKHGSAAKAPAGHAPEGKRFDAWDADISHVTSDMTVHATYVTVYTVRFVDYDGTVIATRIVDKGTDAEAPAAPARTGYTFAGWDTAYTAVGTDITVTATYTINTYTVTFLDADGSVLRTRTVEYGGSVIAPDVTVPQGKLFKEWQAEDGTAVSDFSRIAADITVKAVYVRAVTVVFYAMDGTTELARFVIPEGTGVNAPAVPAEDGYRFDKWSADFTAVTDDLNVIAQYIKIWNVKFVDYDGTVLSAAVIDDGKAAAAPADPTGREGHHFTGWDKDFDAVTADLTVTALYAINTYTVRFLDWDGTVLSAAEVDWNTAAAAPASVPAREDWTNAGWDKTFDAIVADTDIHAVWTPDFTPVSSADDLKALANAAPGFYGLIGDIDVGGKWTSVVLPAGVTFTGSGYTISGLNQALFTKLSGDNTVKNLTLEGSITAGVNNNRAMLAGEASGSITVLRVTVRGTVNSADRGSGNTGGFIAFYKANAQSRTLSFIDCTNEADVTAAIGNCVGGLLGVADDSFKTTIVNFIGCVNRGSVSAANNAAAGGLIGRGYRCGDINVDNCENRGAVSSASGIAGGLVGNAESGTSTRSARVTVTYSTNYGTVSAKDAAGGLIGRVNSANVPLTVENSVNYGNVTSVACAGGILGFHGTSNNNNARVYLRNTAVFGDVTATAGVAAGLIGTESLSDNTTAHTDDLANDQIDNCYVSGSITGTEAASAVIGRHTKSAKANQNVIILVTHCVFDVTLSSDGQTGVIMGAYVTSNGTAYGVTVKGYDTCLYTETLAEGTLWYDGTGALTKGETTLTVGTASLEFLNTRVSEINAAGTYAASRWVEVDGKIVPRNTAYTYRFYGETGVLLYARTVDETAHVEAPKTGTGEGDGVSDKEGYYITAWTIDGNDADFKSIVTDGDKKIVAKTYTGYKYNVQFNDINNKRLSVTGRLYGSEIGDIFPDESKLAVAGKIFIGWTNGGKLYTKEEVMAMTVTGDITFVAAYEDEKTVTFVDADNTKLSETSVASGSKVTAPADPVKEGHTFLGWTADGGVTILSGADIAALTVTDNVTYTAVYEALKYTVIFKDGDTTLSEAEVAWGTVPAVPELTAPAGKAFTGWSDGSVTYSADEMTAYTVKGNVTFTVVWGDIVAVTFVDENYTSDAGDHVWATVTTGKGGNVTPPADPANCPDMTFLGWSDGTDTYTAAQIADLTIEGDITFTAVYTGVSYTVTFKNSNGDLIDIITVGGGVAIDRPAADPERVMPAGIGDCFAFAGWLCNGEAYDFSNPVSGNLTLVASYVFDENNAAGVIGISDLAGLKAIEAGKTYVLTADIEIDDVFWSANNAYRLASDDVAIDGDGHTISMKAGLSAKRALFADTTSGNFYLHNVTFYGFETVCDNQGIVLANFKGSELYVTNVHINECKLTSKYSGPFACDVGGTAVIENCSVTNLTSTLNSKGNMSGFIGSPLQSVVTDITFRNCKVSATFNIGKATVNDGIGGFIGTSNKSTQSTITFENCIANSTIVADSLDEATMEKIGGFIGTIKGFKKDPGHTVKINGGESSCTWTSADGTVTKFAVTGACANIYHVTITGHTENGTLVEKRTLPEA